MKKNSEDIVAEIRGLSVAFAEAVKNMKMDLSIDPEFARYYDKTYGVLKRRITRLETMVVNRLSKLCEVGIDSTELLPTNVKVPCGFCKKPVPLRLIRKHNLYVRDFADTRKFPLTCSRACFNNYKKQGGQAFVTPSKIRFELEDYQRKLEGVAQHFDMRLKCCQEKVEKIRKQIPTERWVPEGQKLFIPTNKEIPVSPEQASLSIDTLDFSVRAENALMSIGVKTIGDLIQYSEKDLLKIAKFGTKSLKEIKILLSEMGLSLSYHNKKESDK